jgi:hypothetical protein
MPIPMRQLVLVRYFGRPYCTAADPFNPGFGPARNAATSDCIAASDHHPILVTSGAASGRKAVISISTFAPIGSPATAMVERAG